MKTKNWILLIITFVALGFVSCSSDDDKGTTSNDILGEWILEDVSIGVLEATDSDVKDIAKEIYEEAFGGVSSGEVIKFKDNGTGIFGGDRIEYSTKGNTLTIEDDEGLTMSFSYAVSGDELILTLDMRKVFIELAEGELNKDEMNYLKQSLKKFTVIMTCVR